MQMNIQYLNCSEQKTLDNQIAAVEHLKYQSNTLHLKAVLPLINPVLCRLSTIPETTNDEPYHH